VVIYPLWNLKVISKQSGIGTAIGFFVFVLFVVVKNYEKRKDQEIMTFNNHPKTSLKLF